jgi:membrane fusion protein, multidrug efflux system
MNSRLLPTLLATAATLAALPCPAQPPSGMQMPVRVVRTDAQTVEDAATAVGTLVANESVMLRPEIDGRVLDLNFKEGQRVQRGQVLVRLDDAEARARLAGAQAELALARGKLARGLELVSRNFVSKQALDEYQETVKRSEAAIQEIRAVLAKHIIRAPFAGMVGLRKLSPGAYVEAGDDVAELVDYASLKLDVAIPQIYLSQVRVGLPLEVEVDAFPGDAFTGRLYATASSIDRASRTLLVRARVDNPAGKLRPGMFAKVRAVLSRRTGAVVVPEQAVVPQGSDSFVFRVVDGKADMVRVVLGRRSAGKVEIRQGLNAGDVVVTEGQIKLRPGMPVKVLP